MEFQEFVRIFMKERSTDYYTKFWSKTASQAGLTVKTPDGKEIIVKPEEIYCEDLGEMIGSCLCGHAIRYQYFLGKVGPIGSTCIQTITGLEGQDLRYILQGGHIARKEVEDFMKTYEEYKTLASQLEKDTILNDRFNNLLERNKLPKAVIPFHANNFPMPFGIKSILYNEYNKLYEYKKLEGRYSQETIECFSIHAEVAQNIENAMKDLKISTPDKNLPITIRDIGRKLISNNPSLKAVDFFNKLVKRGKDPRFIEALNVLVQLDKFSTEIEEFWTKIVKENLDKALQYGLSDAQINFILTKSSTGKDGLAIRFKHLLTKKLLEEEGDMSVKTELSLQTIPKLEKLIVQVDEDERILDFEPDMPE